MRFILTLLLALIPFTSYAQEIVANFDEQGKVIINEELRKTNSSVRNLGEQIMAMFPINLAGGSSVITGTLPVANLPVGTTANKIVQLDSSARLPAVDGSQLTGMSPSPITLAQTISTSNNSTSGSITLNSAKHYLIKLFYNNTYNNNNSSYIYIIPNSSALRVSNADTIAGETPTSVLSLDETNMIIYKQSESYLTGLSIVSTIDISPFSTATIPNIGPIVGFNYIASSSAVGGGHNTFRTSRCDASGYFANSNGTYPASVTFTAKMSGDWKIFVYTLD